MWLLGLAIALQAFLENAVAVFTAVQRLEQELQMRLLEKGVLVTVGFAALGLGAGLLGVAAAFVAGRGRVARLRGRAHPPPRRAARPSGGVPRGRGALARELAPVAQAQFLGVATSRLAPVALVLLAGDQAAGHFGAAFRVYDVAWVVLTSLEAAVYPGARPDAGRASRASGRSPPRRSRRCCSSRCRSPSGSAWARPG